jgi:hypothetical protein
VPSYIDVPVVDYYHGLLYHYAGADWQTNKDLAHQVYFDPIFEEDHARIAEEIGESRALSSKYVSSMPMQASDTTEVGQKFVGMAIFEISNAKAKNVTNGPWQEAIKRGWMSWS